MRLAVTVALTALALAASVAADGSGSDVTVAPPLQPPTPSAAIACGGLRGAQCPTAKQMCQFPEGTCGAADQMGTCVDIPDVCYLLYLPVCGCDGQTYGNACLATAAGTSVAAQGECKPLCDDDGDDDGGSSGGGGGGSGSGGGGAGKFCGGIAGFACAKKKHFCEFAPGDCLRVADAGGRCVRKPQRCPFLYKAVCGCDGKTYSNQCIARANGMSVACDGECPCPRTLPPVPAPDPAPVAPATP